MVATRGEGDIVSDGAAKERKGPCSRQNPQNKANPTQKKKDSPQVTAEHLIKTRNEVYGLCSIV